MGRLLRARARRVTLTRGEGDHVLHRAKGGARRGRRPMLRLWEAEEQRGWWERTGGRGGRCARGRGVGHPAQDQGRNLLAPPLFPSSQRQGQQRAGAGSGAGQAAAPGSAAACVPGRRSREAHPQRGGLLLHAASKYHFKATYQRNTTHATGPEGFTVTKNSRRRLKCITRAPRSIYACDLHASPSVRRISQ